MQLSKINNASTARIVIVSFTIFFLYAFQFTQSGKIFFQKEKTLESTKSTGARHIYISFRLKSIC